MTVIAVMTDTKILNFKSQIILSFADFFLTRLLCPYHAGTILHHVLVDYLPSDM